MTNPGSHHTESEDQRGIPGTANTSGRKTNRQTLHELSHAALTEPANHPTYSREDFDKDIQEGYLYQEILDLLLAQQDLRAKIAEQEGQQQHIANLEETIAQLQSQNELLDTEILQLRNYTQNIELRERVTREGSPFIGASKSPKLPDPATFSGDQDDKLSFEDWMIRIQGKLEGNADHFSTEPLRLAYVVSRLTGDAAKHTAPRLRVGGINKYGTAQELLDHLREIYEDPDRRDKARQKFKSLYMKQSDNFHDFYTKFLHLASEAEIGTSELSYELNDKLSLSLRAQVMTKFLEKPTLAEFARYCTNVDTQLKVISGKRERVVRNQSIPFAAKLPTVSSSLKSANTPSATTTVVSTSTPLRARPQYSDPEQQKLSNIGACFSCGKTGHLSKFCPTKNRIATVEVTTEDAEAGKEHP